MKLDIKIKGIKFCLIAVVALVFSCQPDVLGNGNGITASSMDAGFTITKVANANNTYLLTANASYITSSWDVGVGAGFSAGGATKEVFFPDAGTYNVTHKVTGIGGISETFMQSVNVETSDPVAGNLVKGGKFQDASDHAAWTVLRISASGANLTFNTGSATIFSTQEWSQVGLFQAIEVVKDKPYTIDMLVSAVGGFSDTWFEVFAGKTPPVQGQEYTDNKIMGLSTWDGCATAAFSGLLSDVGCVKNSNTNSIVNTVTFAESGTIYLVVRSGGRVYNSGGITIRNVEFRGSN